MTEPDADWSSSATALLADLRHHLVQGANP
jgi:hypothetical protein